MFFDICLPQLPSDPKDRNEISGGVLTVTIAGGEQIVIMTTKAQQPDGDDPMLRCIEDVRFVGEQDAEVAATFAYIDNAGNLSANPATALFTLIDTVPPVDPGALGIHIRE